MRVPASFAAALTAGVLAWSGAAAIPAADAPPPDPDEIVVVAKGNRDANRDRLTLGADLLDRCSSIIFDKPAKQIRLTCG